MSSGNLQLPTYLPPTMTKVLDFSDKWAYRYLDWTSIWKGSRAKNNMTWGKGSMADRVHFGRIAQLTSVSFADTNLERLIRRVLHNPHAPISSVSLQRVEELDGSWQQISNLSGLEYCANLRLLWLRQNQIRDLSPLEYLTKLQSLALSHNRIADIRPLSKLTNLEVLCLSSNQIRELNPIAELCSLRCLQCAENLVGDLSPVSASLSLESISLGGNYVHELAALSDLRRLLFVELSGNQVTDLRPLVDNTGVDHGDEVRVCNNPLSFLALRKQIPDLIARGVTVLC